MKLKAYYTDEKDHAMHLNWSHDIIVTSVATGRTASQASTPHLEPSSTLRCLLQKHSPGPAGADWSEKNSTYPSRLLLQTSYWNQTTMQSTIQAQQDPFPDRTREPMASTTQPQSLSSSDPHPLPDSNQDTESDQSWKPRFDRRQSWSQEDQKHLLQERLLVHVEIGQETGFTETGSSH